MRLMFDLINSMGIYLWGICKSSAIKPLVSSRADRGDYESGVLCFLCEFVIVGPPRLII